MSCYHIEMVLLHTSEAMVKNMYNSTDFWYTFINSLYNEGLSYGRGELEMDEEMQDKFLAYLKEKIEEGITDGETTLPPGLHNYFWRFPLEMLPKTRELTDTYLKSDPKNGVAALLRTLVEISDWDAENDPHIDDRRGPIPNDPCMNLVVIDQYRMDHFFGDDIEQEVKVLRVLENFYAWAKRQEDSARYQEARSFYRQHRVTPYKVYRQLKDQLRQLQELLEDTAISEESNPEVERYKTLIQKCRDLVPMENGAFRKNFGQHSEEQQDLVDSTSDSTDIWEAFLKSNENRKNAPPRRLTQNDQEHLLEYLKTKIEAGVIGRNTTLPANLQDYIPDFPEAMHLELREFAEEMLETQPDNGAAAKIIAIIVWESKNVRYGESDRDLILLEQAMNLAPNDTETCYFALRKYDEYYDPMLILTVTALERLFARSLLHNDPELYQWLAKLYKEVGKTPCHIYRNLLNNPDANAELIDRVKPLIDHMLHAFQQRLSDEPDDWYALRGLGDVYEVLGETELAQKHPWKPHAENRWKQEAWVGKQLPDFSAVAVDSTPISVSDFNGKLLVLNWCAKWCGFCAPEIPHLKKVYEEYHDKGLEVIGISLDENEAELHEFTKEHEIPWLQVYDGKRWKAELAQFFGILSVPSQWFIDRDGKILSVGTRSEQLSQLVKWTEATRIGNMLPDFTTVDVDGNSVSNATLRGKVALLHFGYIRQEPELEHIDKLYTKHHKNGFEVVGFNVGGWRDEEVLRDIVRRENHQGHYIYADHDGDHAAVGELFGFGWSDNTRKVTLPAFILIDPAGKVIDARYGKVHSVETWGARLDEFVTEIL